MTCLLLFCLLYSVVRYVAFAPQNLDNLPVFISNKGVSMFAALCFMQAFWMRGGPTAGAWFRAGQWAAVCHVPMSLAILRPGYFPEFFQSERLSFHGECVILGGALTLAGLYWHARPALPQRQRWWLGIGFLLTLLFHTLAMGFARGLNMKASHGYLPPMWLLCVIGIVCALGYLCTTRDASTSADTNTG
jgi:hypothetical protein